MSKNGIYGTQYDRYVERYDDSTLSKMQLHYWRTKQTFLSKLKRKEDDCIVASDAELDAKLEVCLKYNIKYLLLNNWTVVAVNGRVVSEPNSGD